MNCRQASPRAVARGFSLLELSLVIVILGLLATVAAINVAGAGERARVNTTKTSMETINQAIKTFALEKSGQYPTSINDMITGNYLEAGKTQDAWERDFFYLAPGRAGNEYELISAGKDGEFGTDDDINIWTMNAE